MKLILLLPAVAGFALVTAMASAQDAGAPPPPPAGAELAAPGMQPPPPPPPGGPRGPGRPSPDGDGPGHDGPGGPGRHGPHGERRGPDEGPKAAHFRIESGNLRIDVKCAEGEPMQACADIASRLLQEAKAPARP